MSALDEFGGSNTQYDISDTSDVSSEYGDGNVNDSAADIPTDFPEDEPEQLQYGTDWSKSQGEILDGGIKSYQNSHPEMFKFSFDARNGADDISGISAMLKTTEMQPTNTQGEAEIVSDFPEDTETSDFSDAVVESSASDELQEDYEDAVVIDRDESGLELEEDTAVEFPSADESNEDGAQISDWQEGETVDIGHDDVGPDWSSYDAGESADDAAEGAEAAGGTPLSMSADSSEWDELKDVPFAGADGESADIEAADGFGETALGDEAATDIPNQNVDDADLGESATDVREPAADTADWVDESTHESGGHDFGDYETKFEKETTNQPETVGEMPPSVPSDTTGWDELQDVPFAGEGVETEESAYDQLSQYMNEHNYGADDYAEYSQDPEWQRLHEIAFPDAEAPELTQEAAYSQLSNYMNEHNYGADNYAEYSQDPEWRRLHEAAFPDAAEAEPITDVSQQSIDDVGGWLSDVNPKFDPWDVDSPYSSNCGSCALAVENRLNGNSDSVATDSTLSIEEMEQQTGMEQVSMQPDEIEQYLISQGPGSHAIIGIDRSEGPGHWFNAYYDGEKVYALDGQTGTTEGWPPDYGDVVNWDVSVKKGE